jgi:hypothetical protein
MGHGSMIVPTMNPSGPDRVKKFPRDNVSLFNAKIDGHHRLESHGIPRHTCFSKWVQFQQQLLPE